MRIERQKSGLSTLRNVGISVLALVVLTLGGGIGYVWWSGQQPAASAVLAEQTEPANLRPEIKAPPPVTKGPVSASVQALTSPVVPASNATITVKTTPQAKCTIKVEYNKIASKDSGLAPKIADEFGVISWTWTVEESVPLGKWPVDVTCAHHDKSAMVRGDLVVSEPPAH